MPDPLLCQHPARPAVCTLADLSYDIYHATIDSNPQEGTAQQEYYVRCAVCVWMWA